MRFLTSKEFQFFISAKPAAAIHFDAEWDVSYRPVLRERMREAEEALANEATFGEVDCDRNLELAKFLPLLAIPAVAYYRNGKLVAVMGGAKQNVRARLERVLRGEAIGYKDGLDGNSGPSEAAG